MREILFRGKCFYNGKWAEGFIVASRENTYPNGFEMITVDGINYDKLDSYIPHFTSYAVDPSTIGQYTGLKDKNGKKIFEGDIVRCGTGRICKVTFFISPGVSGFDLVPIGGFDAPPPHNWSLFADTEVIGNIHDNPELGIKR